MEDSKDRFGQTLGKFKKLILVALTAMAGILLTLSGLNLIELSAQLILYSGISLLVVAVLLYLFN
ncbi:MAG: hypothetical protein C4584_02740 [Armatimonadetes bacterium]|nr:MAG: hypothetical protein C4584_02740 [Armatimonadota bacterium]